MKFSYSWLQSFFSKKLPPPKKLAEVLTLHSFEVENLRKEEGDWIFDIDILPNRPDCLSHLGMAREISVLFDLPLKEEEKKIEDKEKKIEKLVEINVKDTSSCSRYCAGLVLGVKVKNSPSWLQKRLRVCGILPVNNIVDITNYLMLETGQPLHAFDFDKIEKERIKRRSGKEVELPSLEIRRARKNESFLSLDNKKFLLNDDMLVIADSKDVLALAGIKGGKKAEISGETKNILIESAVFDPLVIRKTSSKLNLITDASFRFSYGRDPNSVREALEKAILMVKELAGGEAKGIFDFYPTIVFPKKIKLDFEKTRQLLGLEISDKEIKEILKKLGFKILSENLIEVPTFRLEVDIQENLINEVGRIYGLYKIPSIPPLGPKVMASLNPSLFWENKVKQTLKEACFDEIMSYSFCDRKDIDNFFYSQDQVIEIANPFSLNFNFLRPSLLIGLLKNIAFNQKNFSEIRIFEIGKIFKKEKNKFLEKKMIAGMILGGDFFELKGVIDFLLERMGIAGVWYDSFEATSEDSQQEVWHSTRIAEIKLDHQEIGFLGEISPLLREKYGIKKEIFAFEIDFEKLEKVATEEMEYEEISPFPAAIRDISLIVPQRVRVDEVLEKIQFISPLIRDVDLFDIFDGIEEGKKSLSFHIYFQSKNKTLSDKELDFLQEKIIKTLEKNKGWKVRKKEE